MGNQLETDEQDRMPRRVTEPNLPPPRPEGAAQPGSGQLGSREGMSELKLSEAIDLPMLHDIFQGFSNVTGLPVALLDLDGNVLVAKGWQDICTHFHRVHPVTAENCRESDLHLAGNVPPGEFATYRCKNGLIDVVTPLLIGGSHVGNVYAGQFLYEDEEVSRKGFTARANECGFDRAAYLDALDRVKRVTPAHVTHSMQLLVQITTVMAENAYTYLRLQDVIAEQRRAAEGLSVRRERLEEEVRKRTADQEKTINLMVGREIRMRELKQVVRTLQQQLHDAGISPEARDVPPDKGAQT